METCPICNKAKVELIECDNCGNLACEDCCESTYGGGPEKTFWLCSDCVETMTECEGCGNYIPEDEHMPVCEKCKTQYCTDCIDNHVCSGN